MSKQVTVMGQICNGIDVMHSGLAESLNGTGISPDRFIATAKMAVQTHVQKDRLEKANRGSLYLAIRKCAGDGLYPDNREAALVVYGDQVQYQPMVQGLVKLARQSGEIESINSEVVFENDEFELSFEMDGVKFKHKPDWKGERGKPVLVWATVKLKSGEVIARAYPKSRIDAIATRSKQAGNYNPSTGKDWEEFWRKAAIRNILKYAPKSTLIERALEADDYEFNDNKTVIENEPASAPETKKTGETKASKIVKHEPEEVVFDEPVHTDVIDAEYTEEEELPI